MNPHPLHGAFVKLQYNSSEKHETEFEAVSFKIGREQDD